MMKSFLIILLSLIAFTTQAQVFIGNDGAVHPTGVFPMSLSQDVKGAPKRVTTIAQRDAIPAALRDTGMTCYVTSIDSMYILKGGIANTNWQVFTSGGGAGGGVSNGNALTRTVTADGFHQTIAVYTGAYTVVSVQALTQNGSGLLKWIQAGDSTYIYYGDAPEGSISYKISIIGGTNTDSLPAPPNAGGGGTTGGGGGTTGGGGSAGINSIWTFNTDTNCTVKYGAQYALSSDNANMVALANEGLNYTKVSYNGSGAATYPTYTAGGYNVLLSYNPRSTGAYTALPTDSLAFRNGIKNFINTNGSNNLIGVALINEPTNIKHGTGLWNPISAKNTINLLRSGANALHEIGLQAFDGGILFDEIGWYEVWKDFTNRGLTDSAAIFAASAFPTGTNLNAWASDTAHGYRITYMDSLIAALPTLPLDAVNMHYYETIQDKDSSNGSINPDIFKSIVRYLHRVSGKPVIMDAFGVDNNSSTDILSQLIDAIEDLHDSKNGDMSLAIWYNDANHSTANSDGSLTTFGTALKNKITETRIDTQ